MHRRGLKYNSLATEFKNALATATGAKLTWVWSCTIDENKRHHQTPNCEKLPQTAGDFNNGITSDGKHVYVADLTNKIVNKYEIVEKSKGLLKKVGVINVPFYPDNVEYDEETGKIYGGGVVRLYDLFHVILNILKNSTSLSAKITEAGLTKTLHLILGLELMRSTLTHQNLISYSIWNKTSTEGNQEH